MVMEGLNAYAFIFLLTCFVFVFFITQQILPEYFNILNMIALQAISVIVTSNLWTGWIIIIIFRLHINFVELIGKYVFTQEIDG